MGSEGGWVSDGGLAAPDWVTSPTEGGIAAAGELGELEPAPLGWSWKTELVHNKVKILDFVCVFKRSIGGQDIFFYLQMFNSTELEISPKTYFTHFITQYHICTRAFSSYAKITY